MRYLFFLFLSATMLVANSNVEITGSADFGKVRVTVTAFDDQTMSYQTIDTFKTEKDGSFHYQLPFTEVNCYRLIFEDQINIILPIDGPDKVNIAIKDGDKVVIGCEGSNKFYEFRAYMRGLEEKHFSALKKKADGVIAKGDPDEMAALETEKNRLLALFIRDLEGKIDQLGTTSAVWIMLHYLDLNKQEQFLVHLAEKFAKDRPGVMARALEKKVVENQRVGIGALAPAFSLTSATGQTVTLSDYRGKFVLIDFWASWCQACFIESPKLIDVYQTYKNQGFEVLGVTAQDKEKAWKRAIKKHHLPWTNVFDADDEVANTYVVSRFPSNFLLDEKGRIIAKNLSPDDLAKKLATVLEHQN